MRIRLYSDLHLEFSDFQPPALDADVVVLAGDIHVGGQALPWIERHFQEVPVLYVMGNHEFYRHHTPSLIDRLQEACCDRNHIQVLENRSMVVGNTEFFGTTLWTDFNLFGQALDCQRLAAAMMSDYALIHFGPDHRPLDPADTIEMHQLARDWLGAAVAASRAEHKVVISHHAPSLQSVNPAFVREPVSAAYASNLESFIAELDIDLWLHGHTHRCLDYRIGRTRVMANQRGYLPFDAVAGFQPDWQIQLPA